MDKPYGWSGSEAGSGENEERKKGDSLSHLVDELEVLEACIGGHLCLFLALLLDDGLYVLLVFGRGVFVCLGLLLRGGDLLLGRLLAWVTVLLLVLRVWRDILDVVLGPGSVVVLSVADEIWRE